MEIEPGTSHTRSQHYTIRLSRRRCRILCLHSFEYQPFPYSIVSTLKPFETTITDRHVIRSFGIDRRALTLGISVINESYTISRLEHWEKGHKKLFPSSHCFGCHVCDERVSYNFKLWQMRRLLKNCWHLSLAERLKDCISTVIYWTLTWHPHWKTKHTHIGTPFFFIFPQPLAYTQTLPLR